MRNLAPFFRGARQGHTTTLAYCDSTDMFCDYDNDREADKQAAHDATAWRAWVEREITRGNLTPAARNMPADDVVWQWEQYTGRTYRAL